MPRSPQISVTLLRPGAEEHGASPGGPDLVPAPDALARKSPAIARETRREGYPGVKHHVKHGATLSGLHAPLRGRLKVVQGAPAAAAGMRAGTGRLAGRAPARDRAARSAGKVPVGQSDLHVLESARSGKLEKY